MTQTELFEVGNRRIADRVELLVAIAEKQRHQVQLFCGCAEPGYDDNPVALANWNNITRYDAVLGKCVTTDDTMPRLAKLFEKLGYETEWEDEWIACDDCNRVFRTSPDSHSWTMAGVISDCVCQCKDCVMACPDDYVESLIGNENRALNLQVDLGELGWVKYNSREYKNGLHPGQIDNPHDIANELRANGIKEFIFVIDGKGQFDVSFSVWIRKPEGDDNDA